MAKTQKNMTFSLSDKSSTESYKLARYIMRITENDRISRSKRNNNNSQLEYADIIWIKKEKK